MKKHLLGLALGAILTSGAVNATNNENTQNPVAGEAIIQEIKNLEKDFGVKFNHQHSTLEQGVFTISNITLEAPEPNVPKINIEKIEMSENMLDTETNLIPEEAFLNVHNMKVPTESLAPMAMMMGITLPNELNISMGFDGGISNTTKKMTSNAHVVVDNFAGLEVKTLISGVANTVPDNVWNVLNDENASDEAIQAAIMGYAATMAYEKIQFKLSNFGIVDMLIDLDLNKQNRKAERLAKRQQKPFLPLNKDQWYAEKLGLFDSQKDMMKAIAGLNDLEIENIRDLLVNPKDVEIEITAKKPLYLMQMMMLQKSDPTEVMNLVDLKFIANGKVIIDTSSERGAEILQNLKKMK